MGELSELAQQFETEKANHQQTNNELLATIGTQHISHCTTITLKFLALEML